MKLITLRRFCSWCKTELVPHTVEVTDEQYKVRGQYITHTICELCSEQLEEEAAS